MHLFCPGQQFYPRAGDRIEIEITDVGKLVQTVVRE